MVGSAVLLNLACGCCLNVEVNLDLLNISIWI